MGVTHEPPAQAHWVESMQLYLQPYWREITEGEWAQGLRDQTWSVEALQCCLVQMYPFIHSFPKFLSAMLLKAEDDYTRNFLIDNIRVEKTHADQWIWFGEGFGAERQDMLDMANGHGTPLRDVQSLTDWLWKVNTYGTIAEAMAATCFAVEGATGDIARVLSPFIEAYGDRPGVDMSARTTRWLRNHAKYDDEHPKIALEVVSRWARTDEERTRVMKAAKRSLELLHLALLTGAQAGQKAVQVPFMGSDRRGLDRRLTALPIAFPERRVRDRRAVAAH